MVIYKLYGAGVMEFHVDVKEAMKNAELYVKNGFHVLVKPIDSSEIGGVVVKVKKPGIVIGDQFIELVKSKKKNKIMLWEAIRWQYSADNYICEPREISIIGRQTSKGFVMQYENKKFLGKTIHTKELSLTL